MKFCPHPDHTYQIRKTVSNPDGRYTKLQCPGCYPSKYCKDPSHHSREVLRKQDCFECRKGRPKKKRKRQGYAKTTMEQKVLENLVGVFMMASEFIAHIAEREDLGDHQEWLEDSLDTIYRLRYGTKPPVDQLRSLNLNPSPQRGLFPTFRDYDPVRPLKKKKTLAPKGESTAA